MAVSTLPTFLGNLAQSTTRGPSPNLWGWLGSPVRMETFLSDPNFGWAFWEDFTSTGPSPATGSAGAFTGNKAWYAYLDTNGAITDAGVQGGGIKLAASTTAHQGVALGSLTNSFQIVTSSGALQGRLMFECSVNLSTAGLAASTADMFVGLMDASGLPASAVPITNVGGVLSTAPGMIGFWKSGGATLYGDWSFIWNAAGGTIQNVVPLQGLVNAVTGSALTTGAVKLGFVFNPMAESIMVVTPTTSLQAATVIYRPMIQVYVNGLPSTAFLINSDITAATFPSTVMGPAIAFKQQSTTAAVSAIVDWMGIGQAAIA